MKNLRMFILLLLYGLFTSVQDVMGENVPQHEIKRVLFVSSYDSEQVWGRKVLNGVTKQLNKTSCNVDLRVIYLDSKRLTIIIGNTLAGDSGEVGSDYRFG